MSDRPVRRRDGEPIPAPVSPPARSWRRLKMAKRDVYNEVLAGLREIEAFEKGRKTLRTHRVVPKTTRRLLPVPARHSRSEPC